MLLLRGRTLHWSWARARGRRERMERSVSLGRVIVLIIFFCKGNRGREGENQYTGVSRAWRSRGSKEDTGSCFIKYDSS